MTSYMSAPETFNPVSSKNAESDDPGEKKTYRQLPDGFVKMIRDLLKDEAEPFLAAMQEPSLTSVRLNSRKPGAQFPDGVPVKWCQTGFYLPSRPVFTLDPLLHAGAYYVQDASSMIYREVINRLVDHPVVLLDLCAAPGGKTTAMIDALPDGSRVVANEYVAKRAEILKENIAKWGYPNVTVTNRDSAFFARETDSFDIVAVDAPCSGEGMMRKDNDAIKQWSLELIDKCAALQKDIVTDVVKALKPGGYLIYSTCTFNRRENEEVAQYITDNLKLMPIDLSFPEEWGIPRGIDTELPVYRFMPHKTKGEGLFLAVFQKPGQSPETSFTPLPDSTFTPQKEKRKSFSQRGKRANGEKASVKKAGADLNKEFPQIEEILSLDFNRSVYPEAEVTKDTALAYLRRESITLSPEVPKGLVVITYKGLPLGMVKNIGSRANNLYPKGWRILMR